MSTLYNNTEFVLSDEFVGFTKIPNRILTDRSISYNALGIYTQILQYQNSKSHKLYENALQGFKKCDTSSLAEGIRELISAGYLYKEERIVNGELVGIKYRIYMMPRKSLSYDEYLKTDHWQQVRSEALQRANYRCQLCCSKENLNVHHNNYENLWNEQLEDVVTLCRSCHAKFHNIKEQCYG